MTRFTSLFASVLLLCAAAAHAGVVRVITGPNSYGQGYIFLDQDGVCKVATAGHVVKHADGSVITHITIVDEKDHTPDLGAPIVLSDDPDIAVLPVIGANDPSVCGDGRLSAIGIARRVKYTNTARIETTEGGGIVRVPVRWRAVSEDSAGGSIFTVVPSNSADRIIKGWSGSVVLDDDGLLGIVFEVDPERNEAYAVRADLIRGMIDAAQPGAIAAAKAPSLQAPIVPLAGSTPDPAYGPNCIYYSGDSAWKAVPIRGRIVFMVIFDEPIHLKGVALSFLSKQNALAGMDVAVSTAPGSDNWDSLNYCPIAAGDSSVRCAVVTSTVRKVRVTLKTTSNGAMVLSSLVILRD